MSEYLVMTGGTLTGAPSTITGNDVVDWVPSNCWGSIQTAIDAAGDGDYVTINDEAWAQTIELAFSTKAAISFTTRSRSDDSDICSVYRNTATARLFGLSSMTAATNITLRGFSITNSTAFTSAGGGFIGWLSGADASIAFNNIKFRDMVVNGAINAGTTGALLRTSAATVSRTITFENCTWNNLSITATSCGSFLSAHDNNHVVVTNPTITNITGSFTGTHYGFIYCTNGNLTVKNPAVNTVSLNGIAGNSSVMNGIFHQGGTGTLTITNPAGGHVQNIVSVGHTPHGLFARAQGPYNVDGLIGHDCSMSRHGDDSLGLMFLAYGAGSSGTYKNCHVYNCGAHNGAGFYHSQGASAIVEGLHSHDNYGVLAESGEFSAGAGLYSGGHGDLTLSGSLIYNNTASEGANVYIHRHGTTGLGVDKTVTLNNVTITAGTSTHDGTSVELDNGIIIKSYNANDLLTVNINNSIVSENDTYNVYVAGSAITAGITVNFDYTYLQGGQAGVVSNPLITTETINFTNEITTTPTFEYDPVTDTTYRPANGSSCGAYTGKQVVSSGAPMTDAAGRPFARLPCIGGLHDKHGAFYPVNL